MKRKYQPDSLLMLAVAKRFKTALLHCVPRNKRRAIKGVYLINQSIPFPT